MLKTGGFHETGRFLENRQFSVKIGSFQCENLLEVEENTPRLRSFQ